MQNLLARLVRSGPRQLQRVEVRQQDAAGRVGLTAETVDGAQYVRRSGRPFAPPPGKTTS
ncbi:MAG: hypothetical protein M5U29_14245 [Anaerolineae bacterium]|nr:hypothetical protein [Anaerolineae bacterium]